MTAQQEFDTKYITSVEICSRLGINRSTLLVAIRKERFPKGIHIKQLNGGTLVTLWVRDEVEPKLADWIKSLAKDDAA